MKSTTIMIAALLIGFVTRIIPLLRYIDFGGDQTIDAYVLAGMHHGVFPALGPQKGDFPDFHWPPLHYYLIFPVTLLGPHPTLQALPNAVISLLSIPLSAFILYRLLEGLPDETRRFWGAVGALWQSLLLTDALLGTREWCMSPLAFCVLLFALIMHEQIRNPDRHRQAPAAWVSLGVLTALMISMHGSALYIMPAAFIILSAVFLARASKRGRALALLASACLAFILCLTPYWQGEAAGHWHNTHVWYTYMLASAQSGASFSQKISNAALSYAWLDGQSYFLGDSLALRVFGLFFLLAIIPIAILTFRGNRALAGTFLCIWLLYLYAGSQHAAVQIHYRMLIAAAPILLTVSCAAFVGYADPRRRPLIGLLAFGAAASMCSNAIMDAQRLRSLFGPYRLVAVSDMIDAYAHIPDGARVCYIRGTGYHDGAADRYIDEYVTRRGLRFSPCVRGSYALIPRHVGQTVGSDLLLEGMKEENINHPLAYLRFPQARPGPPMPNRARLIANTDALTIVQL